MRDVERALSYKETGCKKLPLRMVYHMACYGSSFAQSWRKLGAQVSIGTRFINFYPTQIAKFVRLFNKGKTVKKAVKDADTAASRGVVQTYLQLFDATAAQIQGHWPGCPLLRHVMGKHECAIPYFKERWGLSNKEISWNTTKKGRAVVNRSSTWIITGNKNITKNSR